MWELLEISLAPVNIIQSGMLGLVFVYWILFLIGALGLDLFDGPDVDTDIHTDVHTDVNIDVHSDMHADHPLDADASHGGGEADSSAGVHLIWDGIWWFLFRFVHPGDVPVMVVMSVLVAMVWSASVLSTYYWNTEQSGLMAALLLIPNLVISSVVTRFATIPLRYLFSHANAGIALPTRIVGRACFVTTGEVTSKFGQARLDQDGSPITLNVRCRPGLSLKKGDEVIVIEHNESNDTYIVHPLNLEEN